MKFFITIILFAIVIPGQLYASNKPSTSMTTRYALIVGADNAGSQRPALKYSRSDAKMVKQLFHDIGGLKYSDSDLLLNPSLNDLSVALNAIATNAKSSGDDKGRTEFIFYYSGHSDENGLLLKDGLFEYKRLHSMIKAANADVKIAILDSCASGSITRLKGGQHIPPFLNDDSTSLEGYVYLTSSSESEVAQESDKIGSSFFTYHLLSALRGAGDTSLDGKVTLNEAYQYAYNETLKNTQNTMAGAQHPSYDIRIKGAGEVVLTDVNSSDAQLILNRDLQGSVFIRDSRGMLVSEVAKRKGKRVLIAVPAGEYDVSIKNSAGYSANKLFVEKNSDIIVSKNDFMAADIDITKPKGGNSPNVNKSERVSSFDKYMYAGFGMGKSDAGLDKKKAFPRQEFSDIEDALESKKLILGYQRSKNYGFEFSYVNYSQIGFYFIRNAPDLEDSRDIRLNVKGLTFEYVRYLPLNSVFTLVGGLGIMFASTKTDYTIFYTDQNTGAITSQLSNSESSIETLPLLNIGIKADIAKQWATRLNLEIILGFPTVTSETGPYGEVLPFKARELAMLSFDIIYRFD